jgi:hypothetical protein
MLIASGMKTILLALTAVSVIATPALAGKHKKAKPAATDKRGLASAIEVLPEASAIILVKDDGLKGKTGDDFVLKSTRASAQPELDAETFEAKSISDKEAIKIVKSKADELEYCWLKVPAAKRTVTSATLHLAIEASGAVAGVWIDGQIPASVDKCMTERATKWAFPVADAGCEVEHGISFSTLESKGQ